MILGLAAAALAGPTPRLDRVDLLSEPGAPFLVDDLPRYGVSPDVVRLRWFEQVAVVGGLDAVELSLSLAAQTVSLDRPLPVPGPVPVHATVGLRTHAFLPDGALAGLAVRGGPLRLGASVLVVSDTSWSRPDWSTWRVLPALGLGVGPARKPVAPWMQ